MNYQKITYHCYNSDNKSFICLFFFIIYLEVAVVPGNNIVEIWNVNGFDTKNWTLDQTFKEEHTQLITCVDWVYFMIFLCFSRLQKLIEFLHVHKIVMLLFGLKGQMESGIQKLSF
jgi:hypothetical protein